MSDTRRPRGRPRTQRAMTAAERMRRYRARKKARPAESAQSAEVPFSSHRVLDARSLAMHCVIARKIVADPSLLDIARRNLAAWKRKSRGDEPRYLQEWQRILDQPWLDVLALITEQSENAVRLRQSSPFAGVLSPTERKRIYDAFRA